MGKTTIPIHLAAVVVVVAVVTVEAAVVEDVEIRVSY